MINNIHVDSSIPMLLLANINKKTTIFSKRYVFLRKHHNFPRKMLEKTTRNPYYALKMNLARIRETA